MDSIVMQLFNGELYPFEKIVPDKTQYRTTAQLISKKMTELSKKLSEEEYGSVEEVYDLRCEMGIMEIEKSFTYGFHLAVKMMAEIFIEEKAVK